MCEPARGGARIILRAQKRGDRVFSGRGGGGGGWGLPPRTRWPFPGQASRHDAPRVLSVARGDKATLRLATLFQMTYPGAPSIYYGDEIALRGTKRYDHRYRDQDARWPFPWDDPASWDNEMFA